MRTILPLALFIAVAPGLPSCNDEYGVLLAAQVTNRAQLVGGPVAMADVGDFLLQNDQIKVNILGAHDSQGPGLFGGSIVDIDVRRDRMGYADEQGHDRFAEMFPVVNLLDPFPQANISTPSVRVLNDGSDGKEAAIRVEADGSFMFQALGVLHEKRSLLADIFPDVKTAFHFRTDYILYPGDKHITIVTTVVDTDTPRAGCSAPSCPGAACALASDCGAGQVCVDGVCSACEFGLAGDANGCYTCDCAQPISLDNATGPVSVFGQIFGDTGNGPVHRAGVVGGDFVFFGAETDVFAPGVGFDTDKAVHDAFYANQNTFQQPLSYDFVSAAGGDVSYGYFTVGASTGSPVVNMPLFTSAATAFLAAGNSCLFDTSDDATCDNKRAWTYTRYLAVGQGDVGSISDEVWKTRSTPVGTISGAVEWLETGEPALKAHVYVFANPFPDRTYTTVDELAQSNLGAFGTLQPAASCPPSHLWDGTCLSDYGLVDAIDADVGIPIVEQGSFQATLPPGDYVMVARSAEGMGLSQPEAFHLDAGDNQTFVPLLVTPGTVQYYVTDEAANAMPIKAAFISVDSTGNPLDGDGNRRVYLGDGRLGNGVRVYDYSTTGSGTVLLEPGNYLFRASRGPEYGVYEQPFTVTSGQVARITGAVDHEVDTSGWMSTDMHLHATLSFDSGMPLPQRITTVADEGVELAVSTDHDFITDYEPTIRSMLLQPYVATANGVEETTIEQGHFIGFPLKYDNETVPTHGSHDPTERTGGEILAGLSARSADPSYDAFKILCHPRDGFFGYMYQLGVDPYTMQRQLGTLEGANPVFETATCSFDAMEVINGKRFDLVRTPTISEVVNWNRCLENIRAVTSPEGLENVCADILPGTPTPCQKGELFETCRARNRTALAWAAMKGILTRTPGEQAAEWSFPEAVGMLGGQPLCGVAQYGTAAVPRSVAEQPCTYYSGQVDDYFHYLEHGMYRTQISSSDSHESIHEPGYPRTYFQSPTDSPDALQTKDAVASMRAGHALATYGPFITASIDGKTFGDTAAATGGGTATLALKVQTASWFGVDRIEIYENGLVAKVINPKSKPEDIVDFEGNVELDVPKGRDSWVVIIAMGLEDQNVMRPVSLDIPYGEIQISIITAQAFSLIPIVNTLFSPIPLLPDWFYIPAYAVSNPIFLDTDGNGKYDAPLPFPAFCSVPCDPKAAPGSPTNTCPPAADGVPAQQCVPDKSECGVIIQNTCTTNIDCKNLHLEGEVCVNGECTLRIPWEGGSDTLDGPVTSEATSDGGAP
jgi:hypothetical protein